MMWIFLLICFPFPYSDPPQLLGQFSFFPCFKPDAEFFYGDTENLWQVPDDAHGHSSSSSLSQRRPHANALTPCLPSLCRGGSLTFGTTEGPGHTKRHRPSWRLLCPLTRFCCRNRDTAQPGAYCVHLPASAAGIHCAASLAHFFAVYQPDLVVLGCPSSPGDPEKVAYCLVPEFSSLGSSSAL